MKQLREIYGEPLTREERRGYIPIIHKQCIEQMHIAAQSEIIFLISGFLHDIESNDRNDGMLLIVPSDVQRLIILYVEGFDQHLSSIGNMAAECIRSTYPSVNEFNDEIVAALQTLWDEPAIRVMYERRNVTGIADSSAYFWNMLDTLNDPEYDPEMEHILLVNDKYSRKGMSLTSMLSINTNYTMQHSISSCHIY